jgi:hypothetical protein
MVEEIHDIRNLTMEQARNAAVAWMQERLKEEEKYLRLSGRRDEVESLKLGRERSGSEILAKHGFSKGETGVVYGRKNKELQQTIRLDYEPKEKGPHYNVEVGEGSRRKKKAFPFLPPRDVIPRAVSKWSQYTDGTRDKPGEKQIAEAWLDRVIRHRR